MDCFKLPTNASRQHSIAAIWVDSYILSIIPLPIFSHRLDSILIGFVVIRKFRSFNQQRHRADIATNSQTAAMLDVIGHFKDNTLRQLIIILLGLIFLTSCDCYQKVSGTVIDSETSKPITGVKVYNKNNVESKTTTDTLGQFELSDVSGGLGGCPPMTIIIEHVAYKTIEISIPAGGDKMIKIEKQVH